MESGPGNGFGDQATTSVSWKQDEFAHRLRRSHLGESHSLFLLCLAHLTSACGFIGVHVRVCTCSTALNSPKMFTHTHKINDVAHYRGKKFPFFPFLFSLKLDKSCSVSFWFHLFCVPSYSTKAPDKHNS